MQRNTPQKTLECWKQIAAFLERSERTARRWETLEGLPVYRRGHQKHDTVFAYKHEIAAWTRSRTKLLGHRPLEVNDEGRSQPEIDLPANQYLREHDAITRVMDCYIRGVRAGDADFIRPAFHSEATISGFCQGAEYGGSIKHVFDWISANGPAPDVQARFARIEIIETISLVHLEVRGWSGKLVGANKRASDVFSLLKLRGEWKITHKLFHWHED
jgi:hypothetical protein